MDDAEVIMQPGTISAVETDRIASVTYN